MAKQFLDITGVTHLWSKIKEKFATQAELAKTTGKAEQAINQANSINQELLNKVDKSEFDTLKETFEGEQIRITANETKSTSNEKNIKTLQSRVLAVEQGKADKDSLTQYATKSELATAIPNTELDKILV